MVLHPPDVTEKKNATEEYRIRRSRNYHNPTTKTEIPSLKLPLDVDERIQIQGKEDRTERIHSRNGVFMMKLILSYPPVHLISPILN